jgi:CheY-like chemotaxis protein
MKEIIEWLIGIEDRSHKAYERAAMQLKDDKEFADFLWHLAADEKVHYNFMCKAAELVKGTDYPSVVSLNNEARQKVEDYFLLCEKRIEANKLTRENVIDCIISTEFSEWNNMFLYVVNTLKRSHREFIPAAVNMQQHKRYVERFLEARPEFSQFLKRIQLLSRVWQEKILVVEDDKILANLLAAILEDEGAVETAANGEEGLKKVGEKYFAAIVTDVDMPVMDGIEFYKKAIKLYPNIKGRFLFFTGLSVEERLAFFRTNNLKYLMKPSPIADIKKAVINVIGQ